MVRPLRVLFEGAYYHVMNRGQDKRQIYFDRQDYIAFIIACGDCNELAWR